MIRNEGNGNERENYFDDLTKIAEQTLLDDPEFVSSVIGKELKEVNIKLKDERLKEDK